MEVKDVYSVFGIIVHILAALGNIGFPQSLVDDLTKPHLLKWQKQDDMMQRARALGLDCYSFGPGSVTCGCD